MPTDSSAAALAADLVREAGRLALRMRADGVSAQQKRSFSDVVTEADHAAEAMILERLRRECPDDSIVGEEGADHQGSSGRTWVIDPVDGTYNFVAGLDWWCSAVALREDASGEAIVGAVHHPASDRTYVGGPEVPTACNGVALPRLVDRPLAQSCLTTYLHPPFYRSEVGDAFARVIGGVATQRMLGSGSMDATAIAQGMLHVSCQHSVPEWDHSVKDTFPTGLLRGGQLARVV